jgi:HEAT repeat protein
MNGLDDLLDQGYDVLEALAILIEDDAPDLHAALVWACGHPDRAVRVSAALHLALQFRDARALPGLREGLYATDQAIRRAVADAIWEVGDADPAGLVEALRYEHGAARDAAIDALDLVGWVPDDLALDVALCVVARNWRALILIGARAVPGLVAVLNDSDGNVRRGAAWALGEIGDDRAVPHLIPWLDDTTGDMFGIGGRVCDAVAGALERIGTPTALEAVARWRNVPPG